MNNLTLFALIAKALLETNFHLKPDVVDRQLTRETKWTDRWLELDSLDLVVLQITLERELKIELPQNLYEQCDTVGALQDHILEIIT